MLTTLGLYLIILIRYFLIAGLFFWLTPRFKNRRLNDSEPLPAIIKSEIMWSLLTALVFAVPGAIMIESWKSGGTKIYLDPQQYGLPYLVLSVFVYMFLHDTYFFWTHKLMHHPKLFKVFHQVHHNSRTPTPWASFSFSFWEACVEALIIPILAFILPIHIGALAFVLTSMTLFGVTNHAGYEVFPRAWMRGIWGRWMITATHHNLHHRNYNVNYGLYFRFWDKWLGSDKMPEIV